METTFNNAKCRFVSFSLTEIEQEICMLIDGCLQEDKTTNKFGDRAFSVCAHGLILWN